MANNPLFPHHCKESSLRYGFFPFDCDCFLFTWVLYLFTQVYNRKSIIVNTTNYIIYLL
jgi:hypothetical protein